jgi:hypothetical protein
MRPEQKPSIGEAERRVMRSFRLKVGLVIFIVIIGAGYFLWRDWSQGHYVRLLLMPVIALAAAMRSTKGFKRHRPS